MTLTLRPLVYINTRQTRDEREGCVCRFYDAVVRRPRRSVASCESPEPPPVSSKPPSVPLPRDSWDPRPVYRYNVSRQGADVCPLMQGTARNEDERPRERAEAGCVAARRPET